jgi:hypothetical protein
MYMKEKLTVNSGQWSVKKSIFSEIKRSVHCSLSTVHSQTGVGALVVISVVVFALLGVIAVTTPQIRNLVLPNNQSALPSPSPEPQLTEKQQLYLRNKETIQKALNLNDEQFDLLVESAGKN